MLVAKKIVTIMCMVLLPAAAPLFAQQYYVHYTTSNGLPTNEAYNGVMNDKGMLYINSTAGLLRYDGTQFTDIGTAQGLPDMDIVGSAQDPHQRIWLKPFNGNICYYYKSKVYNQYNDSMVATIMQYSNRKELFSFSHSAAGQLIISQRKNQNIFLIKEKKVEVVQVPVLPEESIINAIEFEKQLFVFTNRQYYLLQNGRWLAKNNLQQYINNYYLLQCNANSIYSCLFTGDTKRYILKSNIGQAQVAIQQQLDLTHYNITGDINSLDVIEGSLYFSNKNILYRCDTALQHVVPLYTLPSRAIVGGVLVDEHRNFWIITLNDGIYFFPHKQPQVYTAQNGLEISNPFKIYVDGAGNIYSASGNAIMIVDNATKQIHKIPIAPNSESNQTLRHIVANGNMVHFQFRPNKIVSVNAATKQIEKLPLFGQLPSTDIKDFEILPNGNVLYSYANGAQIHSLQSISSIYNQRTTSLAYDSARHCIYLGNFSTLLAYNTLTATIQDLGARIPLLKSRILFVRVDTNGLVWVFTASNGVVALHNEKIVLHLSAATNLLSEVINNVFFAKKSQLILATNKGISIMTYSWQKGQCSILNTANYNTEDGLNNNFVNDAVLQGNNLYAATSNGISVINTNTTASDYKTKVNIIEIAVNGASVHEEKLSNLHFKQNYLRFSFATNNYGRLGQQYAYRLLPLQQDWSTSASNVKEYGPLDPNTYTFEVVAVDKNGKHIGAITSTFFSIKPAVYQTLWFKTISAIAALLFLIGAIRFYTRQKKTEEHLQQELSQIKIKALRAQMNPHFIFNCLNTIQGFVNKGDNLESNRFISRFSTLIRQTLNFSNESFISLEQEIKYLDNYIALEQVRFNNSFSYYFNVDESILDKSAIQVPTMLLQPFVENAIRHGLRSLSKHGELHISFLKKENTLHMVVDDNGIGRQQSAAQKNNNDIQHVSQGMKIVKEKLDTYSDIFGKKIELSIKDKLDTQQMPTGTQITITLPL